MANKVNTAEKIGSVKIADDVVPLIAAIAAKEVEGVSSIAGSLKSDLANKNGFKRAPKGVSVDVKGKKAVVDMAIGIDYGYNAPETSRLVQDKVKTAIENMTGLNVVNVNVRIASVALPNGEA